MNKLVAFTVGLFVAAGATADAAEIKIISAKAAGLILDELAPQFERATNNKVSISYDEAGIVRKRILGGEAFDVTFLPAGGGEGRGKINNEQKANGKFKLGAVWPSTLPKIAT